MLQFNPSLNPKFSGTTLLQKRFQKELARLGDASAELQEKTAALNEVETALSREKRVVQQLTNEVQYAGVSCLFKGVQDSWPSGPPLEPFVVVSLFADEYRGMSLAPVERREGSSCWRSELLFSFAWRGCETRFPARHFNPLFVPAGLLNLLPRRLLALSPLVPLAGCGAEAEGGTDGVRAEHHQGQAGPGDRPTPQRRDSPSPSHGQVRAIGQERERGRRRESGERIW